MRVRCIDRCRWTRRVFTGVGFLFPLPGFLPSRYSLLLRTRNVWCPITVYPLCIRSLEPLGIPPYPYYSATPSMTNSCKPWWSSLNITHYPNHELKMLLVVIACAGWTSQNQTDANWTNLIYPTNNQQSTIYHTWAHTMNASPQTNNNWISLCQTVEHV